MTNLLFDAPVWIILAIALLGTVVSFMGLRTGQNSMRNYGLGFIGLAILLVVFRMTIVTDEKRVERQTRALVAAVATGDWTSATDMMKHARFYDFSGDEVSAHGKALAQQYGLHDITVNSVEVTKSPNIIQSKLKVVSHHKSQYVDNVPSNWTFEYQKRAAGWVLTLITFEGLSFGDKGAAEQVLQRR